MLVAADERMPSGIHLTFIKGTADSKPLTKIELDLLSNLVSVEGEEDVSWYCLRTQRLQEIHPESRQRHYCIHCTHNLNDSPISSRRLREWIKVRQRECGLMLTPAMAASLRGDKKLFEFALANGLPCASTEELYDELMLFDELAQQGHTYPLEHFLEVKREIISQKSGVLCALAKTVLCDPRSTRRNFWITKDASGDLKLNADELLADVPVNDMLLTEIAAIYEAKQNKEPVVSSEQITDLLSQLELEGEPDEHTFGAVINALLIHQSR